MRKVLEAGLELEPVWCFCYKGNYEELALKVSRLYSLRILHLRTYFPDRRNKRIDNIESGVLRGIQTNQLINGKHPPKPNEV